jgi:hypothetical protein
MIRLSGKNEKLETGENLAGVRAAIDSREPGGLELVVQRGHLLREYVFPALDHVKALSHSHRATDRDIPNAAAAKLELIRLRARYGMTSKHSSFQTNRRKSRANPILGCRGHASRLRKVTVLLPGCGQPHANTETILFKIGYQITPTPMEKPICFIFQKPKPTEGAIGSLLLLRR